jgi:hypothetical protein
LILSLDIKNLKDERENATGTRLVLGKATETVHHDEEHNDENRCQTFHSDFHHHFYNAVLIITDYRLYRK